MKCPNCYKEVPNGSRFCNHCGHKFEQENTIKCTNPDCGHMIPADSKFCPDCGVKLDVATNSSIASSSLQEDSVLCENDTQIIYNTENVDFSIWSIVWDWDTIDNYPSMDWNEDDEGYRTMCNNLEIRANKERYITSIFSHEVPDDLISLWNLDNSCIFWKKEKWEQFFQNKRMTILDTDVYNQIEIFNVSENICFQFRNDGSLRYVLLSAPQDSILSIGGVVLGRTTKGMLMKKAGKIKEVGGEKYILLEGFYYLLGGPIIKTAFFENGVEMPTVLYDLGFIWHLSFNEFVEIAKDISIYNLKPKLPKVISKKGRDVLVGDLEFDINEYYSACLHFDNGNLNGEGASPNSRNTLFSIEITYNR